MDTIKQKFINNKKLILIVLAILLFIWIFTWFLFKSNFFVSSVPEVIWWNFDLNYKKIPYNTDYVDFIFSEDLDVETVIKDNFEVSPELNWELSLVDWNIIRFNLDDNIEIWDNYLFSFSNNIQSLEGENIEDISFDLEVVAWAKVVKINPEWDLDNLNQNFTIFFNIPVVSLTDINSTSNICPIHFEPYIEWDCKWTTTSILEFIPEARLNWATDYNIKVINDIWLLYPLEQEEEIVVSTPDLDYNIWKKFNIEEGIKINFNFPVTKEELEDKLSLSLWYKSRWTWSLTNKEIELTLSLLDNIAEKDKLDIFVEKSDENRFSIKLKDNNFTYDTSYIIHIDEWLNSKNGNRQIELSDDFGVESYWFLSDFDVYRNVYSDTWSLEDTRRYQLYDNEVSYIPTHDLFFNLEFSKEVKLDKNLIKFQDVDWKVYDYSLEYIAEITSPQPSPTGEGVEQIEQKNKKKVKLILNESLENGKEYKIVISKDINEFLTEDIVQNLDTSPKFEVKRLDFISYNRMCLYLSNSLYNVWQNQNNIIYSVPKSRISSVYQSEYLPYPYRNYSDEQLFKLWYCKKAKDWEYLYVVNTRLNPNSEYDIKIKEDLQDSYWNIISSEYSKKVITWDIKDTDKYIYSSVNNDLNVIPSNLPIVINVQTINLDQINLDVCELDELWYIDYMNNRWNNNFSPKCINKVNSNVSVKNNYWNITNNKFDLETDILKNKFKTNFVLVRWKNIWDIYNAFENIYIRSNLSVKVEKAENKSLIFITDFEWNLINQNLSFKFYNHDYYKNKTDEVSLEYKLNNETWVFEFNWEIPDYILVTWDDYYWFLDTNYSGFSNYDFKYISWENTSQKDYLYLYTDRPIYKPWDEVFFKWILRKFVPDFWYTKSDIEKASLEVIDSNMKSIAKIDLELDENSNFNWNFLIPSEVSLWKFSFRFNVSAWKDNYTVQNNWYFYIEEYKKPVFKVIVSDDKQDFIVWDNLSLDVSSEYYFGWKIINTSWNYSVLTQDYFFDSKDYSAYQFWEWYRYFDCLYWGYCNYNDELIDTWEFEIDENWIYNFNYDFKLDEENDENIWEKIYNFTFEVTDPDTLNTVSNTVSKVLHNTDSYVWLRTNYYNTKDLWIDIEWVVLDFEANPLESKKVSIELVKQNYKNVKKKGVDGVFYNEYSLEEIIETKDNAYSDNLWKFEKKFYPQETWLYKVQVTYTWANNESFISSKNIYVASNDYINWRNDNNDVTDIIAEKNQVKIWDTAEYILESPINTWNALIIIEKDDYILDYFVHKIESYSDKIEISVKDNYYPNYYLRAFLIWSEENNPLPIYKRALSVTKVATDYKNLNVSIETDKQKYLPWEKVSLKINVKDSSWNPVKNTDLSISLVDESVLALKGNPKKNPYAFFYDLKRYLWTNSYWSLKNLIDKLEVKDVSDWEKWWAWDLVKWGNSQKLRWVFKDTAFWQASTSTDENGQIEITTDSLPDNLTTWVIEVVASTAEDNKIWVNYSTIQSTKNIIINENLPSFLTSNDIVYLSPVILNKTWKNDDFIVSLEISNAEILEEDTKKVFIIDEDSKTVNFKIKVANILDDLEFSKLTFKVTNEDWDEVDWVQKYLKINTNQIAESVSTFWKTDNVSFEEKIDLSDLENKIWKLTINYSTTLLTSILDWINYLANYSYWCSEQITSSIMPNIFIKKLYNILDRDFDLTTKMVKYWSWSDNWYIEKSVDQLIKEYIVNIRKFQNTDWWFVYFNDINGINYSNFKLSSYILESASQIKEVWYILEESVYFDTIKYLKNRFYQNKIEWCIVTEYRDCKYSEIDRLKSIEAIISYTPNDYEAYKMWKLLDFKNLNNSSQLEKAKLISSLLKLTWLSPQEKEILSSQAQEILTKILNEELVFNPKWAYLWKNDYYSRLENTSLLLEVVSEIWLSKFDNISYIVDNINRWLISQKEDWSFGSTQDNILVIKSITKYLQSSWELNDVHNFTKVKLNNDIIDEKNFTSENNLEVYTKELDLANLKDNNTFSIEKSGSGSIYYDLTMTYSKEYEEQTSLDMWFYITKTYYRYDEYKQIQYFKKEEWKKYISWEIWYDDLEYPKEIYEYLTSVKRWNIWELLIVNNRIMIGETRDKVILESYMPSWAELINPNLDTSSSSSKEFKNSFLDRVEFRQDRYFWYTEILYPWIYNADYLIRLTHAWEYYVKPAKVSEFYDVAVFGTSNTEKFRVE